MCGKGDGSETITVDGGGVGSPLTISIAEMDSFGSITYVKTRVVPDTEFEAGYRIF